LWLLLGVSLLGSLLLSPPCWHAALRTWLEGDAQRHGCVVTVGSIEGSPFRTVRLFNLHWRTIGPPAIDGFPATDMLVDRADVTLAWRIPWLQRSTGTWVRTLVLAGVHGRLRSAGPLPVVPGSGATAGNPHGVDAAAPTLTGRASQWVLRALLPSSRRLWARLTPASFVFDAPDLRLEHGPYSLHAVALRISGARGELGTFSAREMTASDARGAEKLERLHGGTLWQNRRLTLTPLALAPGVDLVSASLDLAQLDQRRVSWERRLTAFGGEIRGQGAVELSGSNPRFEVAARVRQLALRPLARVLAVARRADGLIQEGSFTFRGDPARPAAAQMWLAASATNFRWGERRWEDLQLQAVVVGGRVQVHRLELRQRGNHLSLTGECALPPAVADGADAADALRRWQAAGFSCQIDARLEELHALAELFGPGTSELAGRMSINGALHTAPGAQSGIEGYLNVEGSSIVLRGAPLDYLHTTLIFADGKLRVADLQATHGNDYFTGTGTLRLDRPPQFAGEMRARVGRLDAYTPALAGLAFAQTLARVSDLRAHLRWDEGVLRCEQCEGRFDGASCSLGGSLDFAEPVHPVLDLSFHATGIPTRSTIGCADLQADCDLTIHGRPARLAGEIRVTGGVIGHGLELVPQADRTPGPKTSDERFFAPEWWVLNGGADWALDLHLLTSAPAHLASGGDVTCDLRLQNAPGDFPTVNGTMEISGATIASPAGDLTNACASIYFTGPDSGGPQSSVAAVDARGHELLFGGASDSLQIPAADAAWPYEPDLDDVSLLARPEASYLWNEDSTPWHELNFGPDASQAAILLLR
jgi:hypothetical protein